MLIPQIGQRLICKQVLTYDKFVLEVYKRGEDDEKLVGHLPIELSQLLYNFLTSGENTHTLKVTGKRKREIGLVVPDKYISATSNKKFVDIFWYQICMKKGNSLSWNLR